MDREAWRTTVQGVLESQTQLSMHARGADHLHHNPLGYLLKRQIPGPLQKSRLSRSGMGLEICSIKPYKWLKHPKIWRPVVQVSSVSPALLKGCSGHPRQTPGLLLLSPISSLSPADHCQHWLLHLASLFQSHLPPIWGSSPCAQNFIRLLNVLSEYFLPNLDWKTELRLHASRAPGEMQYRSGCSNSVPDTRSPWGRGPSLR